MTEELDFNNLIPELHYYIHRKPTPGWKIEPCITSFIDITYVMDGKAEYTINDQTYIVNKGDLICIPQNSYRAATSIPDDLIECYATNFRLRNQTGEYVTLPLPFISHIGSNPQLIALYNEMHSEWLQQNFGYMLKVRAILCLILHLILDQLLNKNHASQDDPRIKSSIHYMSAHYWENLTTEEMAKRYHLHPAYYGNLFQKVTGMTFKQYLISIRLNYAENLLKSGEYSVGEVALQCGFSDIFYFSKLFKAKKGIPPSACFLEEKKPLK